MPEPYNWLISILATLIAALIGFFFAIEKFKRQKLWDAKYAAYREILDALEAMILWADETYSHHKMIPTIGSHNLENDSHLSFYEARRVIAKSSRLGQLLFPDEVISELTKLEKELWDEDFRAENNQHYHPNTHEETEALATHAENVRKLIQPRLDKIVKKAKTDLK